MVDPALDNAASVVRASSVTRPWSCTCNYQESPSSAFGHKESACGHAYTRPFLSSLRQSIRQMTEARLAGMHLASRGLLGSQ